MGTLFLYWTQGPGARRGLVETRGLIRGCQGKRQLPDVNRVRMDCRGLVDPKNKPFGRVLPLEVQIKIMFWVHCFYTMDRRKKVVREVKGLPRCDLTGFPQHLGEGRHWNQVVVRLHAPRRNGCHHCHRLMDHRMSVSEKVFFVVMGGKMAESFFFWVSDWHDGGNGASAPQSR